MSTVSHRHVWRRVDAVVVGLFGLWFALSPILGLIEGVRERDPGRKLEFTDHLPILLIVWIIIFLVGLALLFGARQLWRQPAS